VELDKSLVPGSRGEPPSLSKELLAKVRDIVQFVELQQFLVPGSRGGPPSRSKELLAKVRDSVQFEDLNNSNFLKSSIEKFDSDPKFSVINLRIRICNS